MNFVPCPYCEVDTAGQHRYGCPCRDEAATYTHTVYAPPPVGWRCPVCGRGNAPSQPFCPCVAALEDQHG